MKRSKKTQFESKPCKICNRITSFNEFSYVYKKLFKAHNKVENFLQKLNSYRFSFFNSAINLKLYWNTEEDNIYCPECLHEFHEALHYDRTCFRCKRTMTYIEAYSSSLNKNLTKEDLLFYWFNPLIELYCCSCYKKVMKILVR